MSKEIKNTTEKIYNSSTRVADLETLRTDKVVNEKFINKDEWNKQVLNYFEQVVDLQDTGLITDPQMLTDIVTYLTMNRGKDGKLPSYLRTPKTEEQATKRFKMLVKQGLSKFVKSPIKSKKALSWIRKQKILRGK